MALTFVQTILGNTSMKLLVGIHTKSGAVDITLRISNLSDVRTA